MAVYTANLSRSDRLLARNTTGIKVSMGRVGGTLSGLGWRIWLSSLLWMGQVAGAWQAPAEESRPQPASPLVRPPVQELDRALRQFRMHAYTTLQHNRTEYDRFVQAAQQIGDAYRVRGETSTDRDDFLVWLRTTTRDGRLAPPPAWVARVAPGPTSPARATTQAWLGERVGPGRTSPPRRSLSAGPLALPRLSPPNPLADRATTLPPLVRRKIRPSDTARQVPSLARNTRQVAPATALPPGAELINVRELAHLVNGYNEAIRTWEGIAAQDGTWNVKRFEQALAELEVLERRREMQHAYRQALSPASQPLVPPHRATTLLRQALRERLHALQVSPLSSQEAELVAHFRRRLDRWNTSPGSKFTRQISPPNP